MARINNRKILAEIAKRVKEEQAKEAAPLFSIEKYCFPEQIKFIKDESLFKCAVTSRRAGKSTSCAADLVDTLLKAPNSNLLYITLTRGSAKKIIWRELLSINKEFNLKLEINNSELTVGNPNNNSILYISGAKDTSEIEKFRGMSLKKVYIDECQSFRPYIKELVDDIIVPATWDVGGSLILIGTPGPVKAGFFFEASHSSGWSNHKWTLLDNPFIKIKSGKEPAEILAAERARKGITEDDPTYQREALGLWANDDNALVFKFNRSLNVMTSFPSGSMIYIFGIDIGFNDSDAIAVLGYNFNTNRVYLVEEVVKSKQNITQLVEQIEGLRVKYNPVKMVMDAGALGKKIQAEIQQRHQIPLEAADKSRKHEFIELLNDDLRTGKFQSIKGSRFEEDCYLVQWDYDNPEKPEISDSYHSDITDAVLYGWRECKHYIKADVEVKKFDRNSQAYMDELEQKEAEALELKLNSDSDDCVSDNDLDYIFGSD